jgi:hypothetical protein
MFSYSLGGLHLQAECALQELLPRQAAAPADIKVVAGRGRAPSGVPVFSWPGRYGLRLATHDDGFLFDSARDGAFLVARSGAQVDYFPAAEHAQSDATDAMAQLLMRRVLPRVATLHGRTALHGASVMFGEGDAVLLLGASGAGKSTLSVALHEALGWPVLSDDISLIDSAAAPARCFSVVQGACLWPDSLAALACADMRSCALPAHEHKRWRDFGAALVPDSARVRAVIFLDRHGPANDAIALRPMPARQALIGAMGQLVRLNPRDRISLETAMERLARLLQRTPAYALSYPRSYAVLLDVARYLRAQFAALPSASYSDQEIACP